MIHTFSFTKASSFVIHSELRHFWRPIDGWQYVKIKIKSKCCEMEQGQWEVLKFSTLNNYISVLMEEFSPLSHDS